MGQLCWPTHQRFSGRSAVLLCDSAKGNEQLGPWPLHWEHNDLPTYISTYIRGHKQPLKYFVKMVPKFLQFQVGTIEVLDLSPLFSNSSSFLKEKQTNNLSSKQFCLFIVCLDQVLWFAVKYTYLCYSIFSYRQVDFHF